MFGYFSGESSKPKVSTISIGALKKDSKPFTVLIVCPDHRENIKKYFDGAILPNDQELRIIEVMWSEFFVSADSASGKVRCLVSYATPSGSGTIQPDFVLIRSEVRGVLLEQDHRNKLFGLMFANVPSVNSLHSIYCFLERPVIMAELNRLHTAMGDQFPVVNQSYFSSHRDMLYGDSFPAVFKMGHAHAGYGKMKVADHHELEDLRSVMALTPCYASVEPFIEGSYDLRIQKIGAHIRAFRRISVSGAWKTNTGSSHIESIPVTEEYARWIGAASQIFGGLDICTVDAIHDSRSGKEYIMEVNGTSSGFGPGEYTMEDYGYVRELCLEKIYSILREREQVSSLSANAVASESD